MALKPSPSLAVLLLVVHLAAAGATLLAALSLMHKAALLLLISLSFGYGLARDALLLLPHSWRELSLDSEGVSVVRRDGSSFTGTVVGGSTVLPYFIALGIRSEPRRLPVFRVLFPDAMGEDEFRELCVRLRFS